MVIQRLGLLASTTGSMDSIPLVRELRSCMLHRTAKKGLGGGGRKFINSKDLQKHLDEGPSSPIYCVLSVNLYTSASVPSCCGFEVPQPEAPSSHKGEVGADATSTWLSTQV